MFKKGGSDNQRDNSRSSATEEQSWLVDHAARPPENRRSSPSPSLERHRRQGGVVTDTQRDNSRSPAADLQSRYTDHIASPPENSEAQSSARIDSVFAKIEHHSSERIQKGMDKETINKILERFYQCTPLKPLDKKDATIGMLAHRKLLTGKACNAEGYSHIGMYPVTMDRQKSLEDNPCYQIYYNPDARVVITSHMFRNRDLAFWNKNVPTEQEFKGLPPNALQNLKASDFARYLLDKCDTSHGLPREILATSLYEPKTIEVASRYVRPGESVSFFKSDKDKRFREVLETPISLVILFSLAEHSQKLKGWECSRIDVSSSFTLDIKFYLDEKKDTE